MKAACTRPATLKGRCGRQQTLLSLCCPRAVRVPEYVVGGKIPTRSPKMANFLIFVREEKDFGRQGRTVKNGAICRSNDIIVDDLPQIASTKWLDLGRQDDLKP